MLAWQPRRHEVWQASPVSASYECAGARFGRPRDERIDSEVVSAVLNALKRRGYRSVTIEGIARQVGRARSSLYRRWPSKRHLVAYAVVSEMGDNPAANTGHIRGDLEAAVGTLLRAFVGPLGQALAGLASDMAQDPALASIIRREVLAPRITRETARLVVEYVLRVVQRD